jgi:tetratricopeptide (TPR) repeat protein
MQTARTFIAENKVTAARQKLAEAGAHLGNDRAALSHLAAEVDDAKAHLDRFQRFQELIDRAHQAETAPASEAGLAETGSQSVQSVLRRKTLWSRRPAETVPLLLEALQQYQVLERDDWCVTLEGGLLGKHQVEQIRRLAYEELLWLAADILQRQHDHRTGAILTPQSAARAALVLFRKAESSHPPTKALYRLRARSHQMVGDSLAMQADQQLAQKTQPSMAVDHYLSARAAHDAKQLDKAVKAFKAALRLEPTHYPSMMGMGCSLCGLGQRQEDYDTAVAAFTGCILSRPDDANAYSCRAEAYMLLGNYAEAVADYSRAIELDTMEANALILNNRGEAFRKLGELDRAFADYSDAIKLDPKFAYPWNNRVTCRASDTLLAFSFSPSRTTTVFSSTVST